MAGEAFPVFERLVGGDGMGNFRIMAIRANGLAGAGEEEFIGGVMGGVAGEAPLVTCHRRVDSAGCLALSGVTIEAKAVALLEKERPVLGGMGRVAGKALATLERLVLDSTAAF